MIAYRSTTKLAAWIGVFGLALTMASCDGGGPFSGGNGDSCRTSDECNSGFYCRGPNAPHVCGIPPHELCASDADCAMGTFCHAVFDACSQDSLGSECKPACTADNCEMGLRCNAGGACEPIPCDEGFTCPDEQQCDSAVAHAGGPVHTRTSGCVNITCTDDEGCPASKVCVTGTCQDGEGSCMEDIAVP